MRKFRIHYRDAGGLRIVTICEGSAPQQRNFQRFKIERRDKSNLGGQRIRRVIGNAFETEAAEFVVGNGIG